MDAVEEQLYGLIAAAQEQQKAAETALTGLAKERKALAATTDGLKTTLEAAVSKATIDSLGSAPKAATEALKAATEALNTAGAWLGAKFIATFAIAGTAFLVGFLVLGSVLLPSPSEILELRAEKAELESGIADLSKRGGRIKLRDCGGRLCVEVSSNQGTGWTDGSKNIALVIPRGY